MAIGLRYSVLSIALVPVIAVLLVDKKGSIAQRNQRSIVKYIDNNIFHLVWAIPVGVLIGAPSLLVNTKEILSNIGVWAGHAISSRGYEGFQDVDLPSWQFYAQLLEIGWGLPLLILVTLGIANGFSKFKRKDIIIFIFPAVYFVLLLLAPAASSAFARYLVPLLPFLALLIAEGTMALIRRLSFIKYERPKYLITFLIVIFLIAIPLVRVFRLNYLWSITDTRTIAKEWIELHIPEGARLAQQWNGPPLSSVSDPEAYSKRNFDITLIDPFDPSPEYYSIEYYKENDFDYFNFEQLHL